MKRTTVFLDEVAERELDFLSSQTGESKASLVREAISEYLVKRRGPERAPLSFVAIGRSGRGDVAGRHEELLFREPPSTLPRSAVAGAKTRPRRNPRS